MKTDLPKKFNNFEVMVTEVEVSSERQEYWRVLCSLANKPFEPIMEPVLNVKKKPGTTIRPKYWFKEALDYFHYIVVQGVTLSVNDQDLIDIILDFMKVYGPIFNNSKMSISSIRLKLLQYFLFMSMYRDSTRKNSNNVPPMPSLEEFLYHPFLQARKDYPNHKGSFEIKGTYYSIENGKREFIMNPVRAGGQGFIITNDRIPNDDRDSIVKWCQEIVLVNLKRILKQIVVFSPSYSEKTGLTVTARPVDVYGAAILECIDKDLPRLNKMIDPSEKDKNDRLSESRSARRAALSVFRNGYQEGRVSKISRSEYQILSKYSLDLIDKSKLILNKNEWTRKLENYLTEIRQGGNTCTPSRTPTQSGKGQK